MIWYLHAAREAAGTWLFPELPADLDPGEQQGLPTAAEAGRWLHAERANLLASAAQAAATDGVEDEIPGQLARASFAFFHIRGHRADWIRLNHALS